MPKRKYIRKSDFESDKNWLVFEGRMPKVWNTRHQFSKIEGCPYENDYFLRLAA